MLIAALTFLCTIFGICLIIGGIVTAAYKADIAAYKADIAAFKADIAELESKLNDRTNFVLPTAKLQLWDKVLDRHGVEYTVTHVGLSYGINSEHPYWGYHIHQSDDMEILGSGRALFSGIYDVIFDNDIGTKYFVRSGNTQATVQTQNLIKNAGGHHALHS